MRDLYEAWAKFTVKDASGAVIYDSGFLKPDGMLDTGAHGFTNRPVDLTGGFVDNHKVWTIHSMAYDNTVQAGRSALIRYRFHVPDDVKGPLTITARVNYRHLRNSYMNNVFGKDHPAYPVIELASRTRTLNIGDNPATPALATDNADWMRWNNFGIGYLDQLQYEDAMNAFEQVVRLRPDYKDAYINVGLTYIEWEKYADARAPLRKRSRSLLTTLVRSTTWRSSSGARGTPTRRSRICRRSSRSIRTHGMPAASWAFPIISSIAVTKPWSSSRLSRLSIPTTSPRTTIWQSSIAARA